MLSSGSVAGDDGAGENTNRYQYDGQRRNPLQPGRLYVKDLKLAMRCQRKFNDLQVLNS